MRRHYDWNRHWFDRRSAGDWIDGFFRSEEGAEWFEEGVNAWPLSGLNREPCLVLLGEMGLGKSESLREAVTALERQVDRDREVVHLYDLGADESSESLTAKLMGGRQWQEWASDGKILHLFLDSFDEAMISQKALGKLLVRELEAVTEALPRLRLRIACRSAEWPSRLSEELGRIMGPAHPEWSGDLPRELILAQLTKQNAGLAAEAEGLDRWTFLGSIADRDLEGLAALPLTLTMLLDVAKESGGLPDSRKDLFEQTTRRLVAEYDDLRVQPSLGGLQPGQRLAVAERIAAATLFSGHRTIAKAPGKAGPEHLDPAALAGHAEEDASAAGGAAFLVETEQIVEVLRTALFVDAGQDAVRFRHQGLAEFLAAAYLAHHELDKAQLLSLLTVPVGSKRQLIPRLREVAVWTAALYPRILQPLLGLDRDLLLRVGRLHLSAEQAEEIVDGLLTGEIRTGSSPGDSRQLWLALRSLAYPGLAATLGEQIRDPRAPDEARSIAVAIAGACELRESEEDLLRVALDPQEGLDLRSLAVQSLEKFASAKTRRALVPLALEPIADDKRDRLKGNALLATFPGQIDVETLFESLTPPHVTAEFGNYQFFLQERLPETLALSDLPVALRWASEIKLRHWENGGPADDFNLLAGQILRTALPHLADAKIASGVVAVLVRQLRAYRRVSISEGGDGHALDDDELRRALLDCLIDEIGDDAEASGKIDPDWLARSAPPLLRWPDWEWLLERLESAIGTRREAGWAALSARVSMLREPGFERTFDLAERSEELWARLSPSIGTIGLDSDLARRLREVGCDEESDLAVPAGAPYLEWEIAEALNRLEEGEPAAWLRLNDALGYGPRGEDAGCDPLEPDITSMPGWQRGGDFTRVRIVAGARRFLHEGDPEADGWFGREELSPRALAGYRALHLLDRVSRFGPELGGEVWARWVPAILDYPLGTLGDRRRQDHWLLVVQAAREAPEAFAVWAARKVDDEAKAGDGSLSFLKRFDQIRSPSLSAALLPKLTSESMRARSIADLLEWGLARDWVRSVGLVEPRLLDGAASLDAEARETATLAAAATFRVRPAAGCALLLQLLKRDRDLGKAILLQVSVDSRGSDLESIPDGELVELLEALFDLFPPAEEPEIAPAEDTATDGGEGQPRWPEAERMRDAAQRELARRGTDPAVAGLSDLADRYPGHHLERDFLGVAEQALGDRTEGLMEPREIIQICCGKAPFLISSDEDLQQAAIESLKRIQRLLQRGQPRAAHDLWEKSPLKPRHEEEVSDWLSRQLESDLRLGGLEVYREVLSEPNKTGKGRGQSIDIQITAPIGKFFQGAENARVVVEVKASWDSKLKSAMKKQLAETYLAHTRTSHGIFVVLWFAAEEWSDDWRRAPSRRMGLEDMRELFAEQAADLSSSGEVRISSVVLDCSL